jgi:hypothetical protein
MDDYVRQLEDTIERLKTRLESELLGKAVISRQITPEIAASGNITDETIDSGSIIVGCVVFAKIKKKKDGWYGYVLESDGDEGYKYIKFAMKCKTYDETCQKCIKALALDTETAMKIYSVVGRHK